MKTLILLTAEASTHTASDIISSIFGLLILGLCIYFVVKHHKTNGGEEELEKFLNSIEDVIKHNICKAIDRFDFVSFRTQSFEEAQADLFEAIFDDIYDVCMEEIRKIDDSVTTKLLLKVIEKDKIERYVMTVIDNSSINDKLSELYNIAIKDTVEKAEEDEKQLEEEYKDSIYEELPEQSPEDTFVDTENVPDGETVIPNVIDPFVQQQEQEIIPPSEDESETFSEDDESVEVVE